MSSSTSGLSLEQAPPISVPLRFFLTLPVFGAAACLVLLWAGPLTLSSRWSPALLAISHLLTLGVLAMAMCGALFQVLPVLAGVHVARPRLLGGSFHVLLVCGTAALAAAFLGGSALLFRFAAFLLACAFGLFIAVIGAGLLRAPGTTDSVRGLRWALVGLALAITTGLALGLGHGGLILPLLRHPLADLHLAWGLAGWVAALIAVVAYQVVPMFQMTPPYPNLLRRWLAPILLLLLACFSAAALVDGPVQLLAALSLLGALAVFAVLTLGLLARRRRKLADTSLNFWRLGMAALVVSTLLAAWQLIVPPLPASAGALAPALLFLLGFALSVINGMLYKIVPFLVWLHLQQRLSARPEAMGKYLPPTMKTILPEAKARLHLYLHLAALVLLLAGLYLPLLVRPAALAWLAAFVVLAVNLLRATKTYRAESKRVGPQKPNLYC